MAAILRVFALVLVIGVGALLQPGTVLATPDDEDATGQIAVPPLTGRVVDLTGTLTAAQVQALQQTLQSLETRKGSQIAVLIVSTTQPETIEQFGIRVADHWKLGRKGVDDGAILIVAKNDRTLRIEVGYGLEGALNDATCKRIISEIIVPRFQKGDFAGGVGEGVDRMIGVIDGESLPEPSADSTAGGPVLHSVPVILLFALIVGGILRHLLGRIAGAVITGGALGYLTWLVAGVLSAAVISGLIAFVVALAGGGLIGPLLTAIGSGSRGTGGSGGFRGGGGRSGGGGASGRW